jgi:hypothetical protein
MIPIVVITNGAEVRIHSSYDGSPVIGATLDEQRLRGILQAAANQAAFDRREAIRNLLEGSPTAWAEALRAGTQRALAELKGSMEDLTRPLCSDFRFPRGATTILGTAFAVGERVLALVGSPLSGKTNVLSELCDRSEEFELAPLYIDCVDAEDLFEEISLALSDSFGTAVRADSVLDWLRIGIGDKRGGRPRLVVILDSLIPEESDRLRKQAIKVLKNVGPNVAVLFSLTETGYEKVRQAPGRVTASKLGRDIRVVSLEELSEDEIDAASLGLYQQTRIQLPPGARFELPMRQPRTLRLMIAMDEGLRKIPEGQYARLPSIVSSGVLVQLWETTSGNGELRSDLLKLAQAYTNDLEQRAKDAELTLIGIGVGAMTQGSVEHTLGEISLERLLRQGYIKRLPLGDRVFIVPTVPELLSAALIPVLRVIIVESESQDTATKALLEYTRDLPLGDRVAAVILRRLIEEKPDLFVKIFQALMEDEPKHERMREGSYLIQLPNGETAKMVYRDNSLVIALPEGAEAVIPFDEDDDSKQLTSNLHPWNVLSHLAYEPIGIGNRSGMTLLSVRIMERLGRFRSTLKSFGGSSLENPASSYEHSLPGFGRVPCPARGIVEPIVYAMQLNIEQFGEVMDAFVEDSIRDADPALLMRLYVAASSLTEISDLETKTRSERMKKELSRALDTVFSVIHGDGEESD